MITGKQLTKKGNATNTSAQESCRKTCPLLINHLMITERSFSGQAQPTAPAKKIKNSGRNLSHRSKPSPLSPVEPLFVFYICINNKKSLSLQKIRVLTLLSKNRKAVTMIDTCSRWSPITKSLFKQYTYFSSFLERKSNQIV
jgi:hypothetical protein